MRHFQGFGVFDQDAVSRGHPRASHDGRRCRQAQCTRTGNHQHRHRVDQGLFPIPAVEHPTQQREQGQAQNNRHEHLTDLIDDALDRRFSRLRRLDHADDASQSGFAAHRGGLHQQQTFAIDGTTRHQRTHVFRHRQAFACDQGLVKMALPLGDDAVDRHAVAWAHNHDVANLHLLNPNFQIVAMPTHQSGGWAQGLQGANRVRGLPFGAALQPLAQQHQGDDDGRGFKIQMRHAVFTMLEQQVD